MAGLAVGGELGQGPGPLLGLGQGGAAEAEAGGGDLYYDQVSLLLGLLPQPSSA